MRIEDADEQQSLAAERSGYKLGHFANWTRVFAKLHWRTAKAALPGGRACSSEITGALTEGDQPAISTSAGAREVAA
jgi:hypothetical protein